LDFFPATLADLASFLEDSRDFSFFSCSPNSSRFSIISNKSSPFLVYGSIDIETGAKVIGAVVTGTRTGTVVTGPETGTVVTGTNTGTVVTGTGSAVVGTGTTVVGD